MLKIHPIAEVFPMLDEDAFQQLCSDIAEHGLQRQIVTWRGELIDGRNRMRALIALGLDPGEYCRALADDADPVSFALSANLHRRHLTESQRAMIGQRVKELCSADASARMVAGKAIDDPTANLPEGSGDSDPPANLPEGRRERESRTMAAKAVNVSPRLIDAADKVTKSGCSALADAVVQGKVAVSAAAEIADMSIEDQEQVIAEGPEFVKEVAAEKRKERRKERTEAKAEVQAARVPAAHVLGVEPDRSDLFAGYMDPNDILGYLRKLMPKIPDKTILAEMLFAVSDEYERYRIPELWEEWNRKRVRA